MRNIWKRVVAVALSLALCLSFAGCYDENKTWAARQGDDQLPIGGYIYYLYSAYMEAANKVGTDTSVLDSEIEGQDATQWIKDLAMKYLKAYYYVGDKFEEYGLEITEEDQQQVESTTNNVWSYYQSTMEPMGISRASFEQAYSLFGIKQQKLMAAMYGEGGELALEDGAIEEYYCGAYTNYEYFYASLSTTNDEGESVSLSDEEKTALKEQLDEYVDKINKGDMTLSEAADDYAKDSGTESSYMGPMAVKSDNLSSEVFDGLNSVDEDEATVVETTTGYLVLRKLSIKDYYDENVAGNEEQLSSLLSEMKGKEFNDYVLEQASSVEGIELNQAAIDSIKVTSLVSDSNRNGTSSEESAESSSAEESSNSESSASSEASSDQETTSSESTSSEG